MSIYEYILIYIWHLYIYTYILDDKPPPSDNDDSLLDMMIRDGDFTKGFYTNVFACGLMLTNVFRINANNTIIIIIILQNVSCIPARNGRLKVICFWWFYRTIIRYNNMHRWMPKKSCFYLFTAYKCYAQRIKRLKITLLLLSYQCKRQNLLGGHCRPRHLFMPKNSIQTTRIKSKSISYNIIYYFFLK